MKKFKLRRFASFVYVAVMAVLAFMYFTNDYGLVDIRKTAVIIGAGIDRTGDDMSVTAQVAVPNPSSGGGSTRYIEVEAEGPTVAAALNGINKKTGFYPKLVFCKLIVLGQSCSEGDILEVLDYFYRDDYTQLTPSVAMCEGSARSLLGSDMAFGNTATVSIERLLSDEAKRSGNVSVADLKDIGLLQSSPSAAFFMPFIRPKSSSAGRSEQPSSGDSAGSEGKQGEGESGGGGSEFLCDRTAVFTKGAFAGVLSEEDSMSFNLLKSDVRHVFVPCSDGEELYTLGLRSCSGSATAGEEGGRPVITLSFSAVAQLADTSVPSEASQKSEGEVPEGALRAGEAAVRGMFSSLMDALRAADCDVLGLKNGLYRFSPALYRKYGGSLLSSAEVVYNVSLRSAG